MTAPRMSSAPLHRSVCQLTGEVARPSRFWDSLTAADDRNAELVRLRAENADLRTYVEDLRLAVEDRNGQLRRLFTQVSGLAAQRDSARVEAQTAAAALVAVRGAR